MEELINLFTGVTYSCGGRRKNLHLDVVSGKLLALLQLHNKFQSSRRPGCSSQPSLGKKYRGEMCEREEKKWGQEVKAGIGIFKIPKSTGFAESSRDKKTLKDLVWKATRYRSMGNRCMRRKTQTYVPSNGMKFLLFVFEMTKQK